MLVVLLTIDLPETTFFPTAVFHMLTSSCFSFFPLGELTSAAAGKVKPGVGVGFHPQRAALASSSDAHDFSVKHGDAWGSNNFRTPINGKRLASFFGWVKKNQTQGSEIFFRKLKDLTFISRSTQF
jgi:hypothetical protein